MDMNESFAFRDVLIIYINQPELWFWTEATMGVMGWFQQKTKEHVPLNIEKKKSGNRLNRLPDLHDLHDFFLGVTCQCRWFYSYINHLGMVQNHPSMGNIWGRGYNWLYHKPIFNTTWRSSQGLIEEVMPSQCRTKNICTPNLHGAQNDISWCSTMFHHINYLSWEYSSIISVSVVRWVYNVYRGFLK
jgi:hypothetical protein